MKILLFELLAYGITNILVFGSIFENWRQFWNKLNPSFFGKLVTCPLCLSTWIGAILSLIFNLMGYSTPFFEYGITFLPFLVFLDACFTSGCVWLLHTLQESLERAFNKD
jgi:hypothetical protein